MMARGVAGSAVEAPSSLYARKVKKKKRIKKESYEDRKRRKKDGVSLPHRRSSVHPKGATTEGGESVGVGLKRSPSTSIEKGTEDTDRSSDRRRKRRRGRREGNPGADYVSEPDGVTSAGGDSLPSALQNGKVSKRERSEKKKKGKKKKRRKANGEASKTDAGTTRGGECDIDERSALARGPPAPLAINNAGTVGRGVFISGGTNGIVGDRADGTGMGSNSKPSASFSSEERRTSLPRGENGGTARSDRGIENFGGSTGSAKIRPAHPFRTDESDHCETPLSAYRDVAPVLDRIASSLGKCRSNLVVYDPYYCAGGARTKLGTLGFRHVINDCRDFYADVRDGTVPEYDVLLTNPPYSGDHMERLLRFAATGSCERKGRGGGGGGKHKLRRKPFLLLLPHFVYTKEYYRDVFPSTGAPAVALAETRGEGRSDRPPPPPFYLVPRSRYAYVPPAWVSAESGGSTSVGRGKIDTAPFPTFWYCSAAAAAAARAVASSGKSSSSPGDRDGRDVDAQVRAWMERTYGPSGVFKPKPSARSGGEAGCIRFASCTAHIPREFKGEFDPSRKRPNPKARKRMMAKKLKGLA